jgi:glycerol uptake facilitator-like aquaporin
MLLDRIKMEFIGSFLFFFLIEMGSVNYQIDAISEKSLIILNFLTYTLVLWLCKPMSQAHFNPAITFAQTLTKHTKPSYFAFYMFSQFLAAIFAGSMIKLTISHEIAPRINQNTALGFPIVEIGYLKLLFLESFGTMIWTLSYYLMIEEKDTAKYIFAPALGAVFTTISSFLYKLTGASLNPARYLALALLSAKWSKFVFYLFAPLLGALLGGFLGALLLSEKAESSKKRKKKEKNKKRDTILKNTIEKNLLKENDESD